MSGGALFFILLLGSDGPTEPAVTAPSASTARSVQAPASSKKTKSSSSDSTGRFSADLTLGANRSGSATWFEITPSVTFDLNDYWSVEAGLPLYSVNGGLSSDGKSHAGPGDVYGTVWLDLSGDTTSFYMSGSIGAPTGSVTKGLGYGVVTWDWSNYVDHAFGRVTPYGQAGVSNDLDFSQRVNRSRAGGQTGPPVAATGKVLNGEAGLEFDVTDAVSFSVSGYVTAPWGQQIVAVRTGTGPKRREVFVNVAEAARDHGVSAMVSATVTRALDLSLWYWHSETFHANTVSIGAVVHLTELKR